MTNSLLTNKNVKARKDYKCECCYTKIEKGEIHNYQVSVEHGEGFASMRLCLECNNLIEANKDKFMDEDGYYYSELHEVFLEIKGEEK